VPFNPILRKFEGFRSQAKSYQLKLIPVAAPTAPFTPLALPYKTGASLFPAELDDAQQVSNSEPLKTKIGASLAITLPEKNAMSDVSLGPSR
jgi:hypothetical protein